MAKAGRRRGNVSWTLVGFRPGRPQGRSAGWLAWPVVEEMQLMKLCALFLAEFAQSPG